MTTIKLIADGPVQVTGDTELVDAKGQKVPTKETFYLCRCGASANKPFCDGTHKKIGFKS